MNKTDRTLRIFSVVQYTLSLHSKGLKKSRCTNIILYESLIGSLNGQEMNLCPHYHCKLTVMWLLGSERPEEKLHRIVSFSLNPGYFHIFRPLKII